MLKPDFYYNSIFEIPYKRLYTHGLRGLIYDIDNTMAGHYDMQAPEKIIRLANELQGMGFKVALLSNNSALRVNSFNEALGLPAAHRAAKPLTSALQTIMRQMALQKNDCALIGDQLFTDVWCGKRAGITTVLVKPLTNHDTLSVRVKRGLERRLLKRYLPKHVNPL